MKTEQNFNDDKPMLSERARELKRARLVQELQELFKQLRNRHVEGDEWKGQDYGQ